MEAVNKRSNRQFSAIRRLGLTLATVLGFWVPSLCHAQSIEGRTLYSVDVDTLERFPMATAVSVEVTWCEGDQLSNSRQVTAAEIASSIATFARLTNPTALKPDNPDFIYRTVRLRPLAEGDQFVSKTTFNANSIQISDSNLRQSAEILSSLSGANLTVAVVDGLFPNYMRVTVCQDVDLNRVPPRVFVQISNRNQEPSARTVMTAIQKSFDNIVVSQSIENAGDRSPNFSQVRYFFASDSEIASKIRDTVENIIMTDVTLEFLPQLGENVRSGTIELWLGTTFKPREETTFYVCVGEHQRMCPPGTEWIACYTPLDLWARNKPGCQSFRKERLSVVGGNRCGYDVSKITCHSN